MKTSGSSFESEPMEDAAEKFSWQLPDSPEPFTLGGWQMWR